MVAVPAAPNPFFAALMSGVDAPELADLVDRPGWHLDALCRERRDVNFYPERGESTAPAKSVCRDCLVRRDCLADAIEHREDDGVWGGSSAIQRKRARRHGLSFEDVLDALDGRAD
jgi:WhiB family redox-sensing transcriptional regulator